MKIGEMIEEIEKGCEIDYVKDGLSFTCGSRIYGIDLCSNCQEIVERLEIRNTKLESKK